MSIKHIIKHFIKSKTTISQQKVLKSIFQKFILVFVGNNLDLIGRIYGTDKIGSHFYTQHYMSHLRKLKYKKINLLEIGVGGYEKQKEGGSSLRMWKRYFPFGRIFSFDIYDKSALQEKRIKIFQGSQVDKDFLERITSEIGELDIIIDDGSHINKHIIETFQILFPKLKDGGIYAIEDVQTSYWPDFIDCDGVTAMNYFKSLTDCLNNKEFLINNYKQTYFDKKIVSIHFYHNLIFIYKGNNDESSNCVKNGIRSW
jgi:demethylmacrocin O-methyltransferase